MLNLFHITSEKKCNVLLPEKECFIDVLGLGRMAFTKRFPIPNYASFAFELKFLMVLIHLFHLFYRSVLGKFKNHVLRTFCVGQERALGPYMAGRSLGQEINKGTRI